MRSGYFNNNYYIVLEAIEEYCRYRIHEKRIPVVENQGLSVYLLIPDVNAASLFLMDEESFEFRHEKTLPEDFDYDYNTVFKTLVERGTVGNALKTTSISYDHNSTAQILNEYYLVIPLLKAEGVLGLVVLNLNKKPEELNQTFYVICNIYSNIFAFTLENMNLYAEHSKKQEDIDQLIAFRTLKLVQSKNKLSKKFEDLQSNLSMALPHEFRTPINQILGTVDFMIKYPDMSDPAEQKDILIDIKESAERLKRLTENYLFYANLSLMTTDMISIMELQKKVTSSIVESIDYRTKIYTEKYDRIDDLSVNVDDTAIAMSQEYFEKIIDELLENAFKYSDKGTPIEIIAKKENNHLHLSITDYGRGMSKEQIEQIDAYVQFERKVYEQQGSGLGLSIITKLLDLHRGDFSIKSKLGEFTTIDIKIPVADI